MQVSGTVNCILQLSTQANLVSSQIAVTQNTVSEETSVTATELPNSQLKPLNAAPKFEGTKTIFENFGALFSSPVDQTDKLEGPALDAIRGLRMIQQEYEEAKQSCILNFVRNDDNHVLNYMDQLEAMPPLKSNDVQDFKKIADLVRISVLKLQAHGRDANWMSVLCIDWWSRIGRKAGLKL